MLNGLDLFSGYGGISLALSEYVRPITYCEIEKYAQAILLSGMDAGTLPFAPIWTDVTSLDGKQFNGLVDIIYGGFPCQDISCAGKGAGLEGKRSGLFYEVLRLCQEASPQFIFLENVPAIRTRGSIEVSQALASIGYDCRFGVVSAAEIGANHKRERWFLLAYAHHRVTVSNVGPSINKNSSNKGEEGKEGGEKPSRRSQDIRGEGSESNRHSVYRVANSTEERFQGKLWEPGVTRKGNSKAQAQRRKQADRSAGCGYGYLSSDWWAVEPDVGRVANGVTFRPHRIKALGNGVVPLQVKTAFEKLIGIT